MKQILSNPVAVQIEFNLLENAIKLIANAVHPSINGGQLHAVLSNLLAVRDKGVSDAGLEK